MRKRLKQAILACALLLAGCARIAPPACAGWEKPPQVNNPARLVQEEAPLARYLAATGRFGKKQRCWR